MAVILAIDGGGTTTKCLAIDDRGNVLGSAVSGPSNHVLAEEAIVITSISKAVSEALNSGGLSAEAVEYVCAGMAGIGPKDEGREYIEELIARFVPVPRIRATGDMVIAFHGALRAGFGVVVNAGTGSVVYGINSEGVARQVGGWGHLLGDEGSAYDIARKALVAAARAVDGRGHATSLAEDIPRGMGVSDFLEVGFRVYESDVTREDIATLCRVVAESATAGDQEAIGIFQDAAHELALAVSVAIRELEMEGLSVPVACVGSVFDAGDVIRKPFETSLRELCPGARLSDPQFPPVIGAYLLAMKALNREADAAVLETLRGQLSSVKIRL